MLMIMEIQVIIIIVFSNKINGNGQFNFICKSNKCRNAQFDWIHTSGNKKLKRVCAALLT